MCAHTNINSKDDMCEEITMVDRASVAGIIDHTLLKPEATTQQVAALVREAKELGTYSVQLKQLKRLPAGQMKWIWW